jgi:hypothetical protein
MILYIAHELLTAQVDNPVPEPPPISEPILKIAHYFTWLVLLSGVMGITYAGGRFAWEKWNDGPLASPKMVAGGMIGGVVATSAGTLMNSLIG